MNVQKVPRLRKPPKFTPEKVAAVILKAHGNLSLAARRLKCDRKTVQRYVERHAVCERAAFDANEEIDDLAESKLEMAIKAGEAWAIRFRLATKGKKRGYVERVEQTGANGGPQVQKIVVKYVDGNPNRDRTAETARGAEPDSE